MIIMTMTLTRSNDHDGNHNMEEKNEEYDDGPEGQLNGDRRTGPKKVFCYSCRTLSS